MQLSFGYVAVKIIFNYNILLPLQCFQEVSYMTATVYINIIYLLFGDFVSVTALLLKLYLHYILYPKECFHSLETVLFLSELSDKKLNIF